MSGQVIFTGCEAEAVMDGAGGFVVRVWGMDGGKRESLVCVHVPPPPQRSHPQYWTAVEWGGLLVRKLWCEDSKTRTKEGGMEAMMKKKLPPRRK